MGSESPGEARPIDESDPLIAEILANPERFPEIFSRLYSGDPAVSTKGADAVEKITAEKPDLLGPFKLKILKLAHVSELIEVKWRLARIIPRLSLDERETEIAVKILKSWIEPEGSAVVRTSSLRALADFASKNPSLKAEILPLIGGLPEEGEFRKIPPQNP
jgi:hypothetical protein